MYRATAYFGQLAVTAVFASSDIETASINAELAFSGYDMLVVESLS